MTGTGVLLLPKKQRDIAAPLSSYVNIFYVMDLHIVQFFFFDVENFMIQTSAA
ncbi:hypothetical protein ALO_07308 [Acetonema longum DSM 6540]|uniref:Uncharacterized protein n=1 Tax=Acetonema longum DSM 6540 TaxID=1009370 RepID=F7NHB6_9FIRM|nr:hypothetical protein ALO_07308 [Acetonema longum DSM 6540]